MAINLGFHVYEGNSDYLYISYATEDASMVSSITKEMFNLGVPLWYDQGLMPNDNWQAQIANKIKNCKAYICFISHNSFIKVSPFWKVELQIAKTYSIPIVPIYLEEISASSIPVSHISTYMELSTLHGLFADKDSPGNVARKIKESFYRTENLKPNDNSQEHSNKPENKPDKKKISQRTKETLLRTFLCVCGLIVGYYLIMGLSVNSFNPMIIADKTSQSTRILSFVQPFQFLLVVIIYSVLFVIIAKFTHPSYGYKHCRTKEEIENTPQEYAIRISQKKSRVLFACIIPLLVINIATYLLCFVYEPSMGGVFVPFLTICSSIIGIAVTFYIEKKNRIISEFSSQKSNSTLMSVVKIFSIVINVILIFALLTYIVYSGDASAYEPIKHSNWIENAFVYFYHSFSMCFRNESDITVPLSVVARVLSMVQFGVLYFVVLNGIGSIMSESTKK